jgi:hypothetical protein
MVVVRGADAEAMGVMAALPPDLSPFQIGTRGEWQGRGFEIVGRVRVEWAEGSWNEWCIHYDATTTGWLAEAQGLLMVSFAAETKDALPAQASTYASGNRVTINGASWAVSDVKDVTCRASEGELPFAAAPQQKRTSVDLLDGGAGFASIELSDGATEVYVGEYASFDELKLTNLRPVPGWNAEVAEEKNRTTALACPACGAAVQLRSVGLAMSAACGSCGAVIDTATPEFQIIQKADGANRHLSPVLPIGQRGKLLGVEYDVIGMMARTDQDSKWSEFLIFNPWQGFRWLVTFEGHWSFVDRVPTISDLKSNAIEWQGRDYKLYARSTASVTGVLGEFYWKVRRGEQADTTDYIAPPYILSKEVYPGLNEFAWSHGVYVEAKVVGEAFAVKDLPSGHGVYLNAPNPFAVRWKEIRLPFFAVLLGLILLQVYFTRLRPEVTVAQAQFIFTRSAPAQLTSIPVSADAPATAAEPVKPYSTPHFFLRGGEQPVTIQAGANVNNSWLDLDLALVNVQTNQSFPAGVELSYYSGADEDGPWSEGSPTASVSLPGIPPGEYFLAIDPDADPQIQSLPFTVRVEAGGVYASNFIVMLGLVMFYPAMLLWRRHTFERERWEDSDSHPWERGS